MCHEGSDRDGRACDLNLPFLDTLHAGTELTIGGGNPLTHPRLEAFLIRMKQKGILSDLTVRQDHLFRKLDFVQSLIDRKLIYGIGISYLSLTEELLSFCEKYRNAVFHLILGIHGKQVLEELSGHSLKILLLGYKRVGRGISYYSGMIEERIQEVKDIFSELTGSFDTISLDNEAMRILQIEHLVAKKISENTLGS